MSVEGRLTIDLDPAARGSGRARIASSRPLGATRAFVGEPAAAVVKTIPLMFNVCGLAQGAAAAQACEHALGIRADDGTRQARQLLVLAEMLREHLLRAAVDWRALLGLPPQPDAMLRIMRYGPAVKRALDPAADVLTIGASAAPADMAPLVEEAARLVEELVLGEPLSAWRQRRTLAALEDWCASDTTPARQLVSMVLAKGWADAGSAEVEFLPALPLDRLGDVLFGTRGDAFVAAPTWDGRPRETGALSRQAEDPLVSDVVRVHGNGLLARLAGRLVETAQVPHAMSRLVAEAARLSQDCEAPRGKQAPSGRGIAHVEAARGRLVHGVEIAGRIVRRYAILAPTEWNFHAQGAAAQGLADIAGRSGDVRALASLFISSIDPCVGYEVRVH